MEYYYQGRLSRTKIESRLQQVTTRQEVKVHGAKADELMAHLDPIVETMQTPRKALEDAVVKQDPSVAEQAEVEDTYKDTLSKVRK